MGASAYPCLQCGWLTASQDRYVVCDECLRELESHLGLRLEVMDAGAPGPDGVSPIPLSDDERDERLRRLLDDW